MIPVMRRHHQRLTIAAVGILLMIVISTTYLNMDARRPVAFVWPINQTRSVHKLVHPDQRTTRIDPSDICTQKSDSLNDDVLLLIVVCSAVGNVDQRKTIRETWAKDQEDMEDVKVIFMLGNSVNDSLQANVVEEAQKHGDIVQESFLDTYANLTIKSLMLLKWFTTSCKDVGYVMKTDDDMYINVKNLYSLVSRNTVTNYLVGAQICGAKPIRDPHNKWHSPRYMFQGHVYPDYVSGTGYVMSYSSAVMLYKMSLMVPAFHLEDVYITGILPAKVTEMAAKQVNILRASNATKSQSPLVSIDSNKNIHPVVIKPQDDHRFSFFLAKDDPCVYHQIISSHHLSMKQIRSMYEKLRKVRLKPEQCSKLKPRELRPYTPGKCFNKQKRKYPRPISQRMNLVKSMI